MAVEEAIGHAVTFEDVLAAQARIGILAQQTPVVTSRLFDQAARLDAYFKCENLQRGGAFKIRGAANFMLSLTEAERKRGIVTASSGNHAQAVAIVAAHLGVSATIVMPSDAPRAKVDSTLAYGPKVIFFDRLRERRDEIAARAAEQTGGIMLPAFDHPWVVAGQGTAALELLREHPELEVILVPTGGGGLLAGTLIVAHQINPQIKVYGVEPELADDWRQSLELGAPIEIPPPPTIADGLRTPMPGKVTFPIVHELAAGILTVSEDQIKSTVRFLLTRLKLVVEPSGAVAAAAALHQKSPVSSRSAGILLTGGNIDFNVLAGICAEAA